MKNRLFNIRTHSKTKLEVEEFEDKLFLKLTNLQTGDSASRYYYKLEDEFDIAEVLKIEAIVYHMTSLLGLNMWDDAVEN